MSSTELQDEAVGLLQQLLRLNTVNPPGNETVAAELLRDYLEASGVGVELYGRVPERMNLVARLRGGDGPTLCFLSHTDTVVADPAEWSRDPWSGELADGHVWGRGALDMKNQVAASAVAIASLAREGFKPPGDLLFVAAADEEVGKSFGLQWLCEEHPDAVRVDYAVNEGGGERVQLGGRAFYLCAAAEKMSAPFRLVVHGRSGHASMPGIADNALVKTAPLIEKLAAYRAEPSIGPEVAGFLDAVLGEQPEPADVLARLGEVDPLAVETIEPLLSFTLSPTMIAASERRNVVPGTCELLVDRRLLPGQTPEEVDAILRELLGEGDVELETLERFGGTRSSIETPLWDGIAAWVEETDPGAKLAPLCCAGFTDSHWLRDAFGTVAYGFFPLRTMDVELASQLIHSADERTHVDDLALGVDFLRAAARSLA
jgi:acetylornithine deacetylase/succinyl-diaminopimelate desuccinylase-like protein